jgi:hypothetical protein
VWKRIPILPHPLWTDFSYSPNGLRSLSTFFSTTDYYYENLSYPLYTER